MNRGFGKCLGLPFVVLLAISLWWLTAPAARAQARLRVLLLSPEGSAFAQRVRGQTGDLALELRAHVPDRDPEALDLDALLLAQRADGALWLETHPGEAPVVRLFDARSKSTQSRRAELPEGGAADSSATNEIAALLARGELVELLDSRRPPPSTDLELKPPAASPNQSAHDTGDKPGPSERAQEQAPTSTDESTHKLQVGLGAGVRAAQANSARWLLGLEVGAFMVRRALGLALLYAGSFEDERTVGSTRLGLRQDRLAANVSGVIRVLPQLQIQAGAELGVSLFDRTTHAVAGNFEGTPSQRSASFVAAPRLSLLWRPVWYLGLGASLGVDLLTTPPSYELASLNARSELERLRWAQPWCSLGLVGLISALARPRARFDSSLARPRAGFDR